MGTMKDIIDIINRPDSEGKTLADRLEESKQAFSASADAFWNGLSYDDRLKAFYSVCKRIHKGDMEDRGSYRYVLYTVFGFGPDAYSIGMDCGYLDIHNSIYTDAEMYKNRMVFLPDGYGSIIVPNADELQRERDEARRTLCEMYAQHQPPASKMTKEDYAAELGWDCFDTKEETK